MHYTVSNGDFKKSPYTGMVKKHWLEVSHFLLEGVFSNIEHFEDPVSIPRHEVAISYPCAEDKKGRYEAARFEGLARTFLIAGPLIKNEPNARINGYLLRTYYANQILEGINPNSKGYWGTLEDLLQDEQGPINFQQTCECASLVIGLMACKPYIWDQYTKTEQDKIAKYLSAFGHYRTNHHNWRFFNMLILAFLKTTGYQIDEEMMMDHAVNILTYYTDNGWYRDGHLFDYYSPWAFQVYGPIWNTWYGYEHAPEIAAIIEKNSNELMKNYIRFFDKNAHMMMWGRSNIYRSAAAAPFAANMLLKNSVMDPGLARRILSGNLLQFVTKEEMFVNNSPCLGFYGPFSPVLQEYNCAESPFWIANSFVCLELLDDAPLWNAVENNGIWEGIHKKTQTITLDGPGLHVMNHGTTGTTEMCTAKVLMDKNHPWLGQYSRLSFNSKFPWEGLTFDGAEAMNYALKSKLRMDKFAVPNFILYAGRKEGVLYRKAYFGFEGTFQNVPCIDLADIPLSNGILRVDRVRIPEKPYELMLGHYGLPDDGEMIVWQQKVGDVEVIMAKNKESQLAFVPYVGWDKISYKENTNKNPIKDKSVLLYGVSEREKMYHYNHYILITALLHKTDTTNWEEDELNPVEQIIFEDPKGYGSFGYILIKLKDGRTVKVDFNGIEGKLSI